MLSFFERLLGHDFTGVRLHVGEKAAAAAARLGALAFTVGADIFFAAGAFRPDTADGMRLLAHELVHVVQQGAAARRTGGVDVVRQRSARAVQCQLSPAQIYSRVCPPGTVPKSYPSSGRIGTAYGKYLGTMYMLERNPKPYGLVDFGIWWNSKSWYGGTIYDLWKYDPRVVLATMKHEFTRRGLQRTDILDAQRDEVYEIKPVRSAEAGLSQLAGYITELNNTATTTSPFFGPTRPRLWHGGNWDPTRYPLIIPGKRGEICVLHAWQDPQMQGLILYDIVCCVRPSGEEEEEQPALAATKVTGVVEPLKKMKPLLEAVLADYLPKAASGSSYAFLVSPRVFETFVMKPWATEQDAKLAKMYGTRLGPVHVKFLAELFMLSTLLPTGPISDALFIGSGFMSAEEVLKLWGFRIAVGVAVAACFVTLEVAVAGLAVEASVAAEGTVAAASAGQTLIAGESLAAASQASVAVSPFLTGDIIVTEALAAQAVGGEAMVAGASGVAPWMVGPAASTGVLTGGGLGVVGVIVAGFVPADAQAGTPSPANILGADPLYLAPIECLHPRRGIVELGAEVQFGGEKHFIIGLAVAK